MKNYLKRVRECVKDLNLFAELTQEVETNLSKEESLEFGAAVIESAKAVLKENRLPEIVEFLISPENYKGEMKISEDEENIKLCHDIQEKATEICGDWDENAAVLTLASFVLNEGVIEGADTETNVTFGELFGLDDKHEDFAKETAITVAKRKEMTFAGEGSTLPVNTPGLIKLSLKYAPENEAVKAAWDSLMTSTVLHASCESKLIDLLQTEDYTEDTLAQLTEAHSFSDELVQSIKTRVDAINKLTSEDTSVEDLFSIDTLELATLDVNLHDAVNEFLFGSKESYLLELVAITRSNNLTKEDIKKASAKYKIFTKKSLEKLMANLPENKIVEETPQTEKEEINPAAAKTEEVEQKPTIVENSNTNIGESVPSTRNRLLDYYSVKTS